MSNLTEALGFVNLTGTQEFEVYMAGTILIIALVFLAATIFYRVFIMGLRKETSDEKR